MREESLNFCDLLYKAERDDLSKEEQVCLGAPL